MPLLPNDGRRAGVFSSTKLRKSCASLFFRRDCWHQPVRGRRGEKRDREAGFAACYGRSQLQWGMPASRSEVAVIFGPRSDRKEEQRRRREPAVSAEASAPEIRAAPTAVAGARRLRSMTLAKREGLVASGIGAQPTCEALVCRVVVGRCATRAVQPVTAAHRMQRHTQAPMHASTAAASAATRFMSGMLLWGSAVPPIEKPQGPGATHAPSKW